MNGRYLILVPAGDLAGTDVETVLRDRADLLRSKRDTRTASSEEMEALDAIERLLRTAQATPNGNGGGASAGDGTEPPMLLRLREVAQLLGVSLSMVEELSARGDLPVLRLGKAVRVRRDELTSWLDAITADQRKPRWNGGAR